MKYFQDTGNVNNVYTSFGDNAHTDIDFEMLNVEEDTPKRQDQTTLISPLIRNAFEHFRVFLDQNDQKIKFAYIVDLHDLQEYENMHLANKLKSSHVHFKRQIMKVYLATQLFSNSVANAIEICKDSLKMDIFKGSESTIEFLRIMNDLFDIINSCNLTSYKFKKALNPENEYAILRFLDTAKKFIINLKLDDGSYVLKSRRKTGFLEFLIAIESLRNMYQIVKEKKLLGNIFIVKLSCVYLINNLFP